MASFSLFWVPAWEVLCILRQVDNTHFCSSWLWLCGVMLQDVANGDYTCKIPVKGVLRALIRRRREMLMRYTRAFIRFVFFLLFHIFALIWAPTSHPRYYAWVWRGPKFNCASGTNNALVRGCSRNCRQICRLELSTDSIQGAQSRSGLLNLPYPPKV